MEFFLLGTVEVVHAGKPVLITGPYQRALLAMLLLQERQVVPNTDIASEIWPIRPPRIVDNAIHALIKRLRHTLSADGEPISLIRTKPMGYQIKIDPMSMDVNQFDNMRRLARTKRLIDPLGSMRLLRQALALWRGSALQDAIIGPRCRAAATRLSEARVRVQEQLIDLHLQHGEPDNIIDDLCELAELHPIRETLHEQLISALHASGRRADALRCYERIRRRLHEELGTQPSAALQHRYLEILRDDAHGERGSH